MPTLTRQESLLERLERRHPRIPWRDPIRAYGRGEWGYECRICIGAGLHEHRITHPPQFQTRDEFDGHLERLHGAD